MPPMRATDARMLPRARRTSASMSSPQPRAAGTTQRATNFCPSRSSPPPGTCRTISVMTSRSPGTVLAPARNSPVTASAVIGPRPRRRAAMTPATHTRAEASTMGAELRSANHDGACQMPPPPSRDVHTGPAPSLRAANASTPAASAASLGAAVRNGHHHEALRPTQASAVSDAGRHPARHASRPAPGANVTAARAKATRTAPVEPDAADMTSATATLRRACVASASR